MLNNESGKVNSPEHLDILDKDKLSKLAPDRRRTDRREKTTDSPVKVVNDQKQQSAIALIIGFVICVFWLMGIVLAKGWYTVLAIFFPFYSWYLITERLMQMLLIIPS